MERDGKMGGHLDVPTNGLAGRLEVIEGPTGRRQRTEAEKARISPCTINMLKSELPHFGHPESATSLARG
jgi:transposase